MKLAPVLPLRKKSRTRKRVEGFVRLLTGKKKSKAPGPASTLPPARSARPAAPKPSVSRPSLIDAQAALVGDHDAPTIPVPGKARKKKRKPKKNPFLSTPVPETFRPPAAAEATEPLRLPETPRIPADLEAPPQAALEDRTEIEIDVEFTPRPEAEPQDPAPRFPPVHAPPPLPRAPAAPTPVRAPSTRNRTAPHTLAPTAAAIRRSVQTTAPVRAVAVAHEKSNAVGTVELCCTAAGLLIEFVRVSAYTEGYVPYPTTSTEKVTVPYEQVASVEVDGDGLVHLTVDPSCTPYSRLVLAGLVRDPAFDAASSHRHRARIERNVTLAALVAWIPVALTLRAVAPDLSALIVMGIAASASGLLHMLRRDVASKLVLFNRQSEQVRDELLGDLRARLSPGRVRSTAKPSEVPAPEAAPAALGEPEGTEAGSLRGLFVTAGVVAATAAVAILVGKNLLFSSPPEPDAHWGKDADEAWAWLDEDETAATSGPPVSASGSAIAADPTPVIPPPAPCTCERADSPLWAAGVPRMSILSRNRPGRTSYDRPSVYPEIAVVNNSSEDLKDIVMVVDFILGPRDGRKARVLGKQDLFWEGRLGPGKAVKWRVRGRGDDFSVTSFISGMIGEEDVKPAAADTFYDLAMTANTPSVRLHGTKMLAYLGDERVVDGLEKLRAEGREEMADTIEQIALASRPLRVCSVHSEPDPDNPGRLNVKACVYNAGPSEVAQPFVTAYAKLLDASSETRWALREGLPAKTGIVTKGAIDVPRADDAADPKSTTVRVVAER